VREAAGGVAIPLFHSHLADFCGRLEGFLGSLERALRRGQ